MRTERYAKSMFYAGALAALALYSGTHALVFPHCESAILAEIVLGGVLLVCAGWLIALGRKV